MKKYNKQGVREVGTRNQISLPKFLPSMQSSLANLHLKNIVVSYKYLSIPAFKILFLDS